MSELWCIRIPGPDDVFALASKEDAEQAKTKHDAAIAEWYSKQKEDDFKFLPSLENMKAVVELWPWSDAEHAEDMATNGLTPNRH